MEFRPRNLTEYLQAARRRKWLIIVPTLVIVIASVIAIKRLPNVYESSTFVILESAQTAGAGESFDFSLSRRLATVTQQVTSRTRLEAIINRFDLYSEQRQRGARMDDIISGMADDIRVEVSKIREDSIEAFRISYRAQDPEVAQRVTAELANQLIEENVRAIQAQATGEADVLRQRAAELSVQLRNMEDRAPWLMVLKEDAPVAPPTGGGGGSARLAAEALRNQQLTIEGLRDQQYKIQQQLADLNQRIATQRQIVEQQKKSGSLRDNPTYAALVARRAELEGQRDTLVNRQELTEKHPRVQAVNDQIAAIDRQIAELKQTQSGAVSQTPEARELQAMESERNRLQTELEVTERAIQRNVANPPVIATAPVSSAPASPVPRDAGAARLAQDYLGLKQTYKEIVAKLQDAELRRQKIDSDKVEQFRIVDAANLPQLPIWPNRRLLALASLAAGLMVGLVFAAIPELRRFATLQDARDVEHFTRLPMLAAIPKTETNEARSRRRRAARLRALLGVAVAVVAVFALTHLLLVTNLFALIGKK